MMDCVRHDDFGGDKFMNEGVVAIDEFDETNAKKPDMVAKKPEIQRILELIESNIDGPRFLKQTPLYNSQPKDHFKINANHDALMRVASLESVPSTGGDFVKDNGSIYSDTEDDSDTEGTTCTVSSASALTKFPTLTTNYVDAADSFFTMIGQFEASKKEVLQTKQLLKEYKMANEMLKAENRALRQERQFMRTTEIGSLYDRIVELEKNSSRLKQEVAFMKAENEKQRRMIKKKDSELNKMGFEITNTRLKHKSDLRELQELRRTVEKLQSTNKELVRDICGGVGKDKKARKLLESQQELQEKLSRQLQCLEDEKKEKVRRYPLLDYTVGSIVQWWGNFGWEEKL